MEVEVPEIALKATPEAKLLELLHKLNSIEITLCSDAKKEFIKILKSDAGGEFLRKYVHLSSNLSELMAAWNLQQGKPGMSYILSLISVILGHPEGKYEVYNKERVAISGALDRFSRSLIEDKFDVIHKELNSKEEKHQNAALKLLTSIVRRGSGLASDVAKKFEFKVQSFVKLGHQRFTTRKAFVRFGLSFLEMGKPGLLRLILQQKEMVSGILRGLVNDDDETVIHILSTLQDRVLTEESHVPPPLRSVLFGSGTLKHLVGISGRQTGGPPAELAHNVLLMVCTDPCNGLMPDLKRHLKGNLKRLLDLMKKLNATESNNHRDLLLEIVKGSPFLGAAYMEEIPYKLDDFSSPFWFNMISLAANLVSSVGSSLHFSDSPSSNPPSLCKLDVQTILRCISPRSFSRSVVNKGLLHSDFLVKNGTLRFVLEVLKLVDSFFKDFTFSDSAKQSSEERAPGKQEIQNELRTLLPDPQVLLTVLSPLSSQARNDESGLKRKNAESLQKKIFKRRKKREECDIPGDDVIVGGTDLASEVALSRDDEVVDPQLPGEVASENDYMGILLELWDSDPCLISATSINDAETFFYAKLLQTLKIYVLVMPAGLETSFDFFMNRFNNPSALPTTLQSSLLGLLVEYVVLAPRTGILISTPPFMYKHLQAFINLLIFSPIYDVKVHAYKLAQAAMFSTGAFDRNVNEIIAWFLHLPGFTMERSSCMERLAVVQSLSQAVISFLFEATSTVGSSLFINWNVLRNFTDQLTEFKDVSPDFSPLSICVLKKCMKLLSSDSLIFSLPEKTMISVYVCNTLKYLLQIQVDPGMLATVIRTILVESFPECGALHHSSIESFSGWRPLKNLLLFAESILQKNIFCCIAVNETDTPTDSSFERTISEAKEYTESGLLNEKTGSAKAFLDAIVCASPADLLSNLPSVMAILDDLQVPLIFLGSMVFLEPLFLSGILKLWPKVYISGLELAVSTGSSKSTNDRSLAEEMALRVDVDSDKYSSADVAFANLLRQAPFHLLFAATINFDGHDLSESSKIVELLFSKLSTGASDSSISQIRLLLFWFNQIRSSYVRKPLAELQEHAKVCHILTEHLLRELLSSESESKCCMDSAILYEVASTIFCHPVVLALFVSPLRVQNDLIVGNCSTDDFCDSFDALLSSCGEKIHKIDNYVLKLMMKTVDGLLSVSGGRKFIFDFCGHKRLDKALQNLVRALCHELRGKFELCIATEDWVSFLPLFHVCHALARIVSPFELLELVSWVFDRVKIRSSTHQIGCRTSALHIGFCLAADAFETLATYLQLGVTEDAPIYGMWERSEKCFDASLIEKIYFEVCKYATEYNLNSGYIFLLKAVKAVNRQKQFQHGNVHPLSLVLTKVIQSTPIDVLSHCVSRRSKENAELLNLLVEMSPLFSSAFGHLLLGVLKKDSSLHDKVVRENCSNMAEEKYLLLLPASLSYLNSVIVRFPKQNYKRFSCVPSFYARVLINGFCDWKNFVCRPEFQESYDGLFPSTLAGLIDLVNNSVLGKSICMLRHHFTFSGYMEKDDRLKLFKTVYKISDPVDRLLDFSIDEIELYSVGQSLNLINRVMGKISFLSLLLFAKDNEFMSFTKETNGNTEEVSEKENRARTKFINMLVNTWCYMVKRFTPVANGDEKEMPKNCLLVYGFLETFILRMILQLTVGMAGFLIQLESFKFLDKLTESVLLHRLNDPISLEVLRKILVSLSMGRFSCSLYLQRLVSHSQFAPIIHGGTESITSQMGTSFKPMSSILRSLASPHSNSRSELQQSNMYLRRLEVVKLLRVLVLLHFSQSGYGSGGDICINMKDLYFLLLTSYGATVCEVDLVIHSLMRKLESIDESILVDAAKMHYLWGKSALGMKRELAMNKDPSTGTADTEAVAEHQRNYYRENFPIDPRICAATVIHFPYQRIVIDEPVTSDDSQLVNIEDIYKKQGSSAENVQRYDPVFALEFSVHALSVGYIDPMEFAGLGLLAVAFVSISSPDVGLRKLGYETLGRYKATVEMCKRKKETMGLRLLMTNIQNAIEEPWQRIPSVISLFAAESSFILLNSSNDHHSTLMNYLENSSRVDMKKVPLFSSHSINFRADRLWILRLIYTGLNLDEDGQLFIYNSIMKELLSLYSSPLSDDESKKLILLIIKKAVKLHKIAHHLVRDCGLLSWLSSVFPISSSLQTGNEKDFFSDHLLAIIEVINNLVSSRTIVEWLQNDALEQLMGLASHLYKVLGGGLDLLKGNVSLLNAVSQTLVSTLKISQKRKIYQPHFTLSFEGLVQICQAYNECDGAISCEDAELGLQVILMSIPPPDIFLMEEATISRFSMWAISVALASDSKKRREFLSKSSHDLSTSTGSEEAEAGECFLLKLLRWIVACVILGKLARTKFSGRPTSNLQCLLEEYARTEEARDGCKLNSKEIVADAILYIQQLLGMECSMLPSAVSALCLLLSQNLDTSPGEDEKSSIVSLCSRVRFPPEANPAWRWTYFKAWKDLSLEQTDAVKVEEHHACQMLSVMISNCLNKKKPSASQALSLEKSGVFEWETSLIEEED